MYQNIYLNTMEPFNSDKHFLHLETLTSAIPSNGIIACYSKSLPFLRLELTKNEFSLPFL